MNIVTCSHILEEGALVNVTCMDDQEVLNRVIEYPAIKEVPQVPSHLQNMRSYDSTFDRVRDFCNIEEREAEIQARIKFEKKIQEELKAQEEARKKKEKESSKKDDDGSWY